MDLTKKFKKLNKNYPLSHLLNSSVAKHSVTKALAFLTPFQMHFSF